MSFVFIGLWVVCIFSDVLAVEVNERTHLLKHRSWVLGGSRAFYGVNKACSESKKDDDQGAFTHELTPLLEQHVAESAQQVVDSPVFESSIWLDRARRAFFEPETTAWVVYLPKNGKRYCMTCDLRDVPIEMNYHFGKMNAFYPSCCGLFTVRAIQPLHVILGDQFLKGYDIMPNDFEPKYRVAGKAVNTNFGLKDVYNSSSYTAVSFFSDTLKNFLIRYCSALEQKHKVSFDDIAQPLTKDVRKTMFPKFHRVRWEVSFCQCLVDTAEQDTRAEASIFVALGHAGVLKGTLERSEMFAKKSKEHEGGDLFRYKMWSVQYDLSREHCSSRDTRCINYQRTSGWKTESVF